MVGWSEDEVNSFMTTTDIPITINGKGKVTKQSIPAGKVIDKNGKDTDQFITINEKDTTTDCYGKPLKEVSLPDMISYLESNPSDYRRYQPFLNLLKGFNESEWDDGNGLAVLRYGY